MTEFDYCITFSWFFNKNVCIILNVTDDYALMNQGKSSTKKINGFVVIFLFFLIDSFYNKTTEIIFVFS